VYPDIDVTPPQLVAARLLLTVGFAALVSLFVLDTPRHPQPHLAAPAAVSPHALVSAVDVLAVAPALQAPPVVPPTSVPVPPPPAPATVPTGPPPGAYAAWSRVAVCEEGGWVGASGRAYPDSLGISAANWYANGGGADTSPAAQIAVAQRFVASRGLAGWVPDQHGCGPW
jgi:hypothetical protein